LKLIEDQQPHEEKREEVVKEVVQSKKEEIPE
jgi:hypothetical protein